jgi:hypothetical protein
MSRLSWEKNNKAKAALYNNNRSHASMESIELIAKASLNSIHNAQASKFVRSMAFALKKRRCITSGQRSYLDALANLKSPLPANGTVEEGYALRATLRVSSLRCGGRAPQGLA